MTRKVITLEFVIPTVLSIAIAIVLSIGAVYLTNIYLGPIFQAEANYSVVGDRRYPHVDLGSSSVTSNNFGGPGGGTFLATAGRQLQVRRPGGREVLTSSKKPQSKGPRYHPRLFVLV
jgi:hypothetical protein